MKRKVAEELKRCGGGIYAADLAKNIECNYKTVYGHLTQMCELGFVDKIELEYFITDSGVVEFGLKNKAIETKVIAVDKKDIKKAVSILVESKPESFETRAVKPINKKTIEEIKKTVNYDAITPSRELVNQCLDSDNVNSPKHYASGSIECIDAIEASMSKDSFNGFLKGNVQKYLWRYEQKGGVESLEKAQWYLNRLIGDLK